MTEFHETVFIGAGLSCLTAARTLRGDCLVLERHDRPGGLCRTDRRDGFAFDRTGHLLHLRDARIQQLVRRLLPGQLAAVPRDTWVFSHQAFTRYPFQSHFHGLPPEVIAECLLGVFAASRKSRRAAPAKRFDRWVLDTFGPGVARHFMFPYNEKLWTVSPATLTTEWLGRFVPRPDLEEVVLGALRDRPSAEGYNARFLYPKVGGIDLLPQALARGVKRIWYGADVTRIDLRERTLRLASGERLGFGRLVSSAPLKDLVGRIRPLPDRIRRAKRRLRAASVFNLNLGIPDRGERRHWVYVPEKRYALYRFGYANNFSSRMAPPGLANVYTEVAYRGRPPEPGALLNRVIADLQAIGVLDSARDVAIVHPLDIKVAYAIYDQQRTQAVNTILKHLNKNDIFPIGRYGRWEYGSMEDAMIQGLELATKLLKR